jgi:hypothetical protein
MKLTDCSDPLYRSATGSPAGVIGLYAVHYYEKVMSIDPSSLPACLPACLCACAFQNLLQ